MPKNIEYKNLIEFASSLEGKLLSTTARRKAFHINILKDGLEIIPQSSGKSRRASNKNLKEIIDHFNNTKSIQPKDYHDITYNSVYILKIMEEYLKRLT